MQLAEIPEEVVFEAKSFSNGGVVELQKEIDAISQKLAEAKANDPKNTIKSDLGTVELQLAK